MLCTQSSRVLLNLVSIKCSSKPPADSTTADTPKPFLVLPSNDLSAVGCSFLFCNNLAKYHIEEYPAANLGPEHIGKNEVLLHIHETSYFVIKGNIYLTKEFCKIERHVSIPTSFALTMYVNMHKYTVYKKQSNKNVFSLTEFC